MGASSRARALAAIAARTRAARHRRLALAWLVCFPSVVAACVLLGVAWGDIVGGLRTGVIFGFVLGVLVSLPAGPGGPQSTSSYVDSGGDGDGAGDGDAGPAC